MLSLAEERKEDLTVCSFKVECSRGGLEVIDRWTDDWRQLCAEAAEDQPFYRPEWIRAFCRKFGRGHRVCLITARRNGRLCLILPLLEQIATYSKVPLRRLHSPVNSTSGRFDAVRRRGPEGEGAIRATWSYLKALGNWDLLQFNDSLEGSTVSQIAAAAEADGFLTIHELDRPNPCVTLPSEPGGLKQMPHNAKLRSQLRQLRSRLAERGEIKFYRINTADRRALDQFYQLEASGWKGKVRSCALYDGSRSFYDEVAESAAQAGYLVLYRLELNGRLLAAHYSFSYGDRCYSPKVAYDEEFKPFAPGHLIVAEILRDCVDRGIHYYDITGQDQPWKLKWATGTRSVSHHYIFRGRLGRLAYAVRFRVGPAMRGFLGRAQHS
jgi:CelD/BcsL family acetyltransferase involved in cellulose biosynthesis